MLNGSHSSMRSNNVLKTDFISEHRSLQIKKLFCPVFLTCTLKIPEAKHSLRKQKRDIQGRAESLFSTLPRPEIPSINSERRLLPHCFCTNNL